MSTAKKIILTIAIVLIGGTVVPAIFGDEWVGEFIRGVVVIGIPVVIWNKPKIDT